MARIHIYSYSCLHVKYKGSSQRIRKRGSCYKKGDFAALKSNFNPSEGAISIVMHYNSRTKLRKNNWETVQNSSIQRVLKPFCLDGMTTICTYSLWNGDFWVNGLNLSRISHLYVRTTVLSGKNLMRVITELSIWKVADQKGFFRTKIYFKLTECVRLQRLNTLARKIACSSELQTFWGNDNTSTEIGGKRVHLW